MGGPHLAVLRQREQPLVHRAEDLPGALGLLDREVGARDVADEQAVAAQHGPRIGAAGGVDQEVGGVLGTVTGGMRRAHQQRPQPSSQPSSNGSWS